MATYETTDTTFHWTLINTGKIQSELKKIAKEGARKGKAFAVPHKETGDLYRGIRARPDVVKRAAIPVTDWLVEFGKDHIHAVEYGHMASGWYAEQEGAKFVPGIRVAHKTLRAMGG